MTQVMRPRCLCLPLRPPANLLRDFTAQCRIRLVHNVQVVRRQHSRLLI